MRRTAFVGAALVVAATRPRGLDASSLVDRLVADYLAAKPRVLRGDRLTEREYAGLWLASWGERALATLDTSPIRRSLESRYPGLRKLLELALAERRGAA